jgi:hypothetical protein
MKINIILYLNPYYNRKRYDCRTNRIFMEKEDVLIKMDELFDILEYFEGIWVEINIIYTSII